MTVVIEVGDDPAAWAEAGFVVVDGVVVLANALIKLSPDASRGIVGVAAAGVAFPVAGLCFGQFDAGGAVWADSAIHPNGVTSVDHLVAVCESVEQTSRALTAAGLECRRTRVFGANGERRQDFFWLEDVILELTGPAGAGSAGAGSEGDAALSNFWGLALVSADIDATKQFLGDLLGEPGPAVQPGRRIATLLTRPLDISVPIAMMSPHESGVTRR